MPGKFIYCKFCQKIETNTAHKQVQAEYYIGALLTIINYSE